MNNTEKRMYAQQNQDINSKPTQCGSYTSIGAQEVQYIVLQFYSLMKQLITYEAFTVAVLCPVQLTCRCTMMCGL